MSRMQDKLAALVNYKVEWPPKTEVVRPLATVRERRAYLVKRLRAKWLPVRLFRRFEFGGNEAGPLGFLYNDRTLRAAGLVPDETRSVTPIMKFFELDRWMIDRSLCYCVHSHNYTASGRKVADRLEAFL